jgi:putative endonuclease
MTNDLDFRHRKHLEAGAETFVGKYKVYRVVYFEEYQWVQSAIAREKEIKGWSRRKKEALINSMNPEWKDLSAAWGKPFPS